MYTTAHNMAPSRKRVIGLRWRISLELRRDNGEFDHMIRQLVAAAAITLWAFPAASDEVWHESGNVAPVVVELFTSQGCSSCPPADALLGQLAAEPDVIALALHVDYWDYIGWTDAFGSPDHTVRQKNYARAAGRSMIYTPEMIIDGVVDVAGHRPETIMAAIRSEQSLPSEVMIGLDRGPAGAAVRLEARMPLQRGAVVQLVRFIPEARVAIATGENAGRIINYANVVTDWSVVAHWDGQDVQRLDITLEGPEPAALIVQEEGYGRILAAARLR